MKKFLLSMTVVLVVSLLCSVGAFAVSWIGGKGYDVYVGASYGESEAVAHSPVTFFENHDGSVTVEQGGYYHSIIDGSYYGGVATAEKVSLDGLEVEIKFDEVPIPTNDCFFVLSLMQKPYIFNTADIGSNGGWYPLIRFTVPNIEYYGGNEHFVCLGRDYADYGMFGLRSGDILKMKVKKVYNHYEVSYEHNGISFDVPWEITDKAMKCLVDDGGYAHVVVSGSLLGDLCDWRYSVKVNSASVKRDDDVAVTIPQFPVTVNGQVKDNTYIRYPYIVYNDITYFPMTYYGSRFLGLQADWTQDAGLVISKLDSSSSHDDTTVQTSKNGGTYTAKKATGKITVNGKTIDNSKEQYPLLVFRDVTYFPLTWRFAADEFGWYYSFTNSRGLEIISK